MALPTPKFYTPAFQQVFVDQETQHVMAGGKVYFKNDNNRDELKTIYQLASPNPPYTFVEAENPQTLNMAGAFNQAVYLSPFDDAGNVELYYIDVYNIDNVQQFNRPKMPEFSQGSSGENQDLKNYVINPQFQTNFPRPTIDHPKTMIAPFGWSFVRSTNATSVDSVTFQRFNSPTTNPQSNPRYAVRIRCTDPSTGNTIKALRFKIPNVNFLQGTASFVTYSFEAISNSGSPLSDIELVLVKNYGSGGDPQEDIPQTSFTFATGYNKFSFSFAMGDNTNKIIGTDDDDFVAFDLRLPPEAVLDVSLTNFILTPGVVVNPTCPEPNWESLRTLAKTGDIKPVSIPFEEDGWLLADGTAYSRDVYSDLFSFYAFKQNGTTNTAFTFSMTGTTVSGQPNITALSSTKRMYVGMSLTGANFAAPVTILSITSDTAIVVSANATTSSSVSFTFTTAREIRNLTSTATMFEGMELTGLAFPGIPKIVSINSLTEITVDVNASSSTPDVVFTFYLTGAGDGATTFNVPKMMNNLPIGSGDLYKLGQRGGSKDVTLVTANLPPHMHTYQRSNSVVFKSGDGTGTWQDVLSDQNTTNGSEHGLTSTPFSVLNPYLGLSYLVKT